jgi:hypothetical protein
MGLAQPTSTEDVWNLCSLLIKSHYKIFQGRKKEEGKRFHMFRRGWLLKKQSIK